MRGVRDIKLFENIPILVRAPLNVPIKNGWIVNDYRLRRALLTIRYLCERGARIALVSHIGEKGTETLAPVAEALRRLSAGRQVTFCPETVGVRARAAVRALSPGDILVLENLRRHKGEQGNDPAFARELAALADIFIQDSFDTCHRMHASIVGVPKLLPSFAGLLLEEEMSELSQALKPKRPALAVIGGAKFKTKEAVLTTLLEKYDHVFVGGALAHDFLRASGQNIGKSLASSADISVIKKLLVNPKLVLPMDSVAVNDVIVDHGPRTVELLLTLIGKARTILWNGPLGKYEEGYVEATAAFARAVADSGARSVVGGGDTIASIEGLGFLSRFSFVSTGGGAMLQFLAHGTLPGIDALG